MDIEEFNKKAADAREYNKAFYGKLKRKPPEKLDVIFQSLHEEVFDEIDCLECGNCCRTTSPIFYDKDIDRAAKAVRMKPGQFADKYLRVDEDGDQVLKSSPCPFLGADNYCAIYADRPTACREYPHTNRKNMRQILDLTFRNTMVCPAVLKITSMLEKQLGNKS